MRCVILYIRTEAAKLAENKAKEVLTQLNGGKAVDVKWSEVSVLGAQQARQSMPPEAYAELLKAKPANGKPAYVRLTGLPKTRDCRGAGSHASGGYCRTASSCETGFGATAVCQYFRPADPLFQRKNQTD